MYTARCVIHGPYTVTATLTKPSKCSSVREFNFFDLLFAVAEMQSYRLY